MTSEFFPARAPCDAGPAPLGPSGEQPEEGVTCVDALRVRGHRGHRRVPRFLSMGKANPFSVISREGSRTGLPRHPIQGPPRDGHPRVAYARAAPQIPIRPLPWG